MNSLFHWPKPPPQTPSPKAKVGSWLKLDIVAGQPRNLKLDEKETESARQRHVSPKLRQTRPLPQERLQMSCLSQPA